MYLLIRLFIPLILSGKVVVVTSVPLKDDSLLIFKFSELPVLLDTFSKVLPVGLLGELMSPLLDSKIVLGSI